MLLVADSGSSKTDWVLRKSKGRYLEMKSLGYNPVYIGAPEIIKDIQNSLRGEFEFTSVREVWFYGAGCSSIERSSIVKSALSVVFPSAKIRIRHDVLGAARAGLGHEKGIAGILGTGANACFYDGREILKGLPSYGYLFGDEGSGAYLGKVLVNDFLKDKLPEGLSRKFKMVFDLDKDALIEKIYASPKPNRVLASFSPFYSDFRGRDWVEKNLYIAFQTYFDAFIKPLEQEEKYPLSMVGSIAYHFKDVFQEVAEERGIEVKEILKVPVQNLMRYHESGF